MRAITRVPDMLRRTAFVAVAASVSVASAGCQADATPPPPPPSCDEECKDGIAVKALREMMKLAFNLTFQGKPVGEHDLSTPCMFGGTARVYGTATSNAIQGATEVSLTYVFTNCGYQFQDDDPDDNYKMNLDGTMTQQGIIAVQPSTASAVVMKSDAIKLSGTIYDPPIDYTAECPVELGQNGNIISAKICGRDATADL
jgi:hypothetical protein